MSLAQSGRETSFECVETRSLSLSLSLSLSRSNDVASRSRARCVSDWKRDRERRFVLALTQSRYYEHAQTVSLWKMSTPEYYGERREASRAICLVETSHFLVVRPRHPYRANICAALGQVSAGGHAAARDRERAPADRQCASRRGRKGGTVPEPALNISSLERNLCGAVGRLRRALDTFFIEFGAWCRLKAISHLSALIGGFAMVVMVEITMPSNINFALLVIYGLTSSSVVGLMLLAVLNSPPNHQPRVSLSLALSFGGPCATSPGLVVFADLGGGF